MTENLTTRRRTLVKGAAWSVPAVAVTAAAPVASASLACSVDWSSNSCKNPGGGTVKTYEIGSFCLNLACIGGTCTTANVTITRIETISGEFLTEDPTATLETLTPIPLTYNATDMEYCAAVNKTLYSTNSASSLRFYVTVAGCGPTVDGSFWTDYFLAPPNC